MMQIGDRRQLMADLTQALAAGSPDRVLAVFRLHGFRELLERSGTETGSEFLTEGTRRLTTEVGPFGQCYQSRRDEWCALFDGPLTVAVETLDAVTRRLNDAGEEYGVVVEAGIALLPEEAADPIAALERADRRAAPADAGGAARDRRVGRRIRRGEA